MVDVDSAAVLLQVQTPERQDADDGGDAFAQGGASPVCVCVCYLVWKGWTLGDLGGLFASTASSWMDPLSEATAK